MMTTKLPEIKHIRSGKVRDIYSYGDNYYLFHTSDRISAFDVVLPDEIPGKGQVLNEVSEFWMKMFEDIIPNHLVDFHLPYNIIKEYPSAILIKKLTPLPVEAIVRGYIIGSGWKDYQATGKICGHRLPDGLLLAGKLPEVLYTPSTKADVGDHDINITFDKTVELVGMTNAINIKDISIKLYKEAAFHAEQRGIIIADTKFEFGTDKDGKLYLIDEVLTPDSSRFWPKAEWEPGKNPPSYDKQIIRDYLSTLNWDKKPPAPHLPKEIILKTITKYQEMQEMLTSNSKIG